MKFCEDCHSCIKPCGKQEKAWYSKKEVDMTKYEKLRIFLGVLQLVAAIGLALRFKGL